MQVKPPVARSGVDPKVARRSVGSHENPTDSDFDVAGRITGQAGGASFSQVEAKSGELAQSTKSSWTVRIGLITSGSMSAEFALIPLRRWPDRC
jgi:hypothetical protein